MFKKPVVVLCSGALVGSLLIAAPSGAFAAEPSAVSPALGSSANRTSVVDSLLSDYFEECPTTGTRAPMTSSLGKNLGSGVTEELTPKMLLTINESRVAAGKAPLGKNVKAMRYFDSGRIVALNSNGEVISEVSSAYSTSSLNQSSGEMILAQPASAKSEVKRFIKACFGLG